CITTGQAVIASGPFSGPVAALAGLELPLETVRRHKLVMPELAQVPHDAPMTIDEDTGAHWRPALAGAYLLWTDPTTPPSDPSEAVRADSQFYFSLLDPASPTSVSRIVPFWEKVWRANTAPWMLMAGQYTMTPDHRPLLGPSEVEGIWLNCGYSGHGIMGSPAGSRMLVDLLTGRLPTESNQFRFDREFEPREQDIL
ncbi:MAG: FAD-binding oxidoreductase, partial [Candidatus Thermoplasmatota archaeon]|nr:FAD-binding oxidoreductase [Candidatus Thermoplasmatota archaeon]